MITDEIQPVSQTVEQVLAGFFDAFKSDNSLTLIYMYSDNEYAFRSERSYITDKVMERKTHQVTASDRNEGLDSVKGPSYTSLLHQE